MSRKVIISKRASLKLIRLLEYLETEWSAKVKDDFIQKLDKSLLIIQKNTDGFEKSKFISGLHKCVITKQISLFYKHDKNRIFIVSIFDNRQHPNRLIEEI